ncbi:MAG: hypothetical protein V4610_11625 [Pseudomonadota bacterium]
MLEVVESDISKGVSGRFYSREDAKARREIVQDENNPVSIRVLHSTFFDRDVIDYFLRVFGPSREPIFVSG